jgi:pimeloyl-ACP methyl ester carboxylesterase
MRFGGRRFEGEIARPVQILVWYPSSIKARSKRMQYREYLHLGMRELSFQALTADDKRKAEEEYTRGIPAENLKTYEWLMAAKTASVAEAPKAKGMFPLVIYAPGSSGSAYSNSIMCEYLASHGYVVAALPSIGAYRPKPILEAIDFEDYARDIEFVLAAMRTFPNTDAKNAAIIGHSMGGTCSVIVQMRNMNLRAAVYLDTVGIYKDFVKWDALSFRAPQLYLARKAVNNPELIKDVNNAAVHSFLWGGDYIQHFSFCADGMIAKAILDPKPKHALELKALFENVCCYTVRFLNGYLKNDLTGIAFLKRTPEENGIVENLVESYHNVPWAPVPLAWDKADMMEFFKQEGSLKFRDAYAKSHALSPGLLFEIATDFWNRNDRKSAVDIAEMSAEMHPASSMARALLSRVYEMTGVAEKAVLNAETALKLLPGDASLDESVRKAVKTELEDRIKKIKK